METGKLAVEEVGDPARFAGLEGEWNELLASSAREMPFLRHEWLRTWWKHFGVGSQLAVFLVRRGGRLVLALPLFAERSRCLGLPLTTLRSTSNEHSFRFDLILAQGEESAVDALWQHLAARGGWHLIQLRDVVWPGADAGRLADVARKAGHPTGVWLSYESPFLPIAGNFAAYDSSLHSKFRSNLRNRSRRISTLGPVSFEAVAEPERAGTLLPAGLELEGSGWKREAGSAIAADPTLTAFYTEWADIAARSGWLRLHFLRVAERAVAFDYSLRYGRTLYCLKMGYDPEFAPFSAGQLLKERILERAFAEGCDEYDFLGPTMEAKADWRPQVRRHAWLFLYNRDALSRLAHLEKFRLRPFAKGLLRR